MARIGRGGLWRHLLLSLLAVCWSAQVMVATADVQIGADPSGGVTVKTVPDDDNRLGHAYALIEVGKYRQALLEFNRALEDGEEAHNLSLQAEALSGAGYALQLLQKPEDASKQLNLAIQLAQNLNDRRLEARARSYLGLVYANDPDGHKQATAEFERGQSLARDGGDRALGYANQLQLARIGEDQTQRLNTLREVASALQQTAAPNDPSHIGLLLNIQDQAKQIQQASPNSALGNAAGRLGKASAEQVLRLADKSGQVRAQAQAQAYLSWLASQEGNAAEALSLANQAVRYANLASAPDLAMNYQAALGRLLAKQGNEEEAIKAYRLAVYHVGEVRNDIPLTYPDGRSSYTETLEPIYRGLAGLLLQAAARHTGEEKQKLLLEAIYILEKLKQSELEDYFSDRCALDAQTGAASAQANLFSHAVPAGEAGKYAPLAANLSRSVGKKAILYPIVFDDRLELLLISNGEIRQQTVKVGKAKVAQQAQTLNALLRQGKDYWVPSRQLYQWVILPLAGDLRTEEIRRIVYIPDGALRLAPLAALHDGKGFVAEHYEVVTNSVLQSVSPQTGKLEVGKALLAGLSVPDGPSLEQIPKHLLASTESPPKQTAASRSAGTADGAETLSNRQAQDAGGVRWANPAARAKTVESLSLPGVEEEIHTIEGKLPNKTLLNQSFTKHNLEEGVQSGEHQLVHISSHGYFGHSAKDSFIMTYDKNLSVGEVEKIMRINQNQNQPVGLVTFSACETAEGDERAPLGFSGLAIKASARNAMGALWPISDSATKHFMEYYYSALSATGGDPAESLHLAQQAMLREKPLNHPSFWSPFIVVGAW